MLRPALLGLLAALLAAAPAHAAAPCSHRGADEVRYDDGRLLIERGVRSVDPGGTVRERWWACWRPTGRRFDVADVRHRPDADELALVGVRGGRFLALGGGGRLDVLDGRTGRLTASMELRGAVRELVVTSHGRAAALQAAGPASLVLLAADGTRSCLQDAGPPGGPDGSTFGGLTVRRERLSWHRDGVEFGAQLSGLSC
jgi:hypothetical protein